jgi:hypothetical protein
VRLWPSRSAARAWSCRRYVPGRPAAASPASPRAVAAPAGDV